MTSDRPRIAIIGSGPRALWALECLENLVADRSAQAPATVTVFGPAPVGAGSTYALDQPDYLRLNVTSATVDVWRGAVERGPSFDRWRRKRAPQSAADRYPPRALVGQYLRDQATDLIAKADFEIAHRTEWVQSISRDGDSWRVNSTGGFSEVLLATGHTSDAATGLRHRWSADLPPLQPTVFPVTDLLQRPEIKPGATIAIRGAALTAIDAVLALSLGRGLQPGRNDVSIMLFSRTGRLMTPKPEPSVGDAALARAGDLSGVMASARNPAVDPARVLCETAVRLAPGVGRSELDPRLAFESLASNGATSAVAQARRQIAMATGQIEPDFAWALGQAWRHLYPAFITRQERLSDTETHPLRWASYHQWAHELERVAFGPPLVNAKLLLEGLQTGRITVEAGGVESVPDCDLVVDAVLPGPGVRDLSGDHLLRQLGATARPGFRGVRVASDAQLLNSAGRPIRGVSAVGRATEDEVVGNDTLNRHLHLDIERWARRVLRTPNQPKGESNG